MKIERKPDGKVISFAGVPVGAVFKGENGDICMVIDKSYANSTYRNAVNLCTGTLYCYDDNEEVEILENAVLAY